MLREQGGKGGGPQITCCAVLKQKQCISNCKYCHMPITFVFDRGFSLAAPQAYLCC